MIQRSQFYVNSSFAELHDRAETDFSKYESESKEWWLLAEDILRHFSIKENLIKLLHSLCDRSDLLEMVARRSTISDSLDKIVLLEYRDEEKQQTPFRLRLHIWKPSNSSVNEEMLETNDGIHPHYSSFSSVIICGFLKNTIWMVKENCSSKTHNCFRLTPPPPDKYNSGHFIYHKVDEVSMHIINEAEMHEGSIYHMPAQTLHTAWQPVNRLSATLLISGPYVTQDVVIYHDKDSSWTAEALNGHMSASRKQFTEEELHKSLSDFINYLKEDEAPDSPHK